MVMNLAEEPVTAERLEELVKGREWFGARSSLIFPVAAVCRAGGSELRQALLETEDASERVSPRLEPFGDVSQAESVATDLRIVKIVPLDWHRDRGTWSRAHTVRSHQRTVRGILGVVESGTPTAVLLVPCPTNQVRHGGTDGT